MPLLDPLLKVSDTVLAHVYSHPYFINIIISILGFFAVIKLIPPAAEMLAKRGLSGIDLNKKKVDDPKRIPEGLGLVVGSVFLTCIIIFELFNPHTEIIPQFHTALLAICFMLLLGFADDVLGFRWRSKIFLSAIAALPLAAFYTGATAIMVPMPFRGLLGNYIELGLFYKIYVGAFTVFCTNGINIYAGINGLEVSQSIIVGLAIIVHAYIQIYRGYFLEENRFALWMATPFVLCSFGLLKFNKFPSRVFVGDSYTYMAGMTLGTIATLGHFSKTVMLFFMPQLINFALSLPQLLGLPKFLHRLVPEEFRTCPRHRLPKYDEEKGKLVATRNLTLINAVLYLFGPRSEQSVLHLLSFFHVIWCAVSFGIRFWLASLLYEKVR